MRFPIWTRREGAGATIACRKSGRLPTNENVPDPSGPRALASTVVPSEWARCPPLGQHPVNGPSKRVNNGDPGRKAATLRVLPFRMAAGSRNLRGRARARIGVPMEVRIFWGLDQRKRAPECGCPLSGIWRARKDGYDAARLALPGVGRGPTRSSLRSGSNRIVYGGSNPLGDWKRKRAPECGCPLSGIWRARKDSNLRPPGS